jgi:putative PIN family toxin of toxin-antitoxin system
MNVSRVVLDTNVLISAVLFGGKPRDLFRLIIQGRIDAFTSPALDREFRDVLSRPKFKLTAEKCFLIYKEIETLMMMVFPKTTVDVIRSDPDDNAVLECALEACADHIVTGDPHLLDLAEFKGIMIVTPAVFLQKFR